METLPTVTENRRNELLADAIDMHVHTAPDSIERYATDLDTAREAIAAGMRGVVLKSHIVPTAGRVDLTNREFNNEILHGGVTLNGSVGGINPAAVEVALDLGARVIWLPTAWARNHAQQARDAGESRFMGQRVPTPEEDISLLDHGDLTPEVHRVIELVGAADATLATGHVSVEEALAVAEACANSGVRCLVNHAFFRVVDASIEEQVQLADHGAVIEFCAYSLQSTPNHSIQRVVEAVTRLGPENCLLATDFGQVGNAPTEGLARFAEGVIQEGVNEATVQKMMTETPARVLGIDD